MSFHRYGADTQLDDILAKNVDDTFNSIYTDAEEYIKTQSTIFTPTITSSNIRVNIPISGRNDITNGIRIIVDFAISRRTDFANITANMNATFTENSTSTSTLPVRRAWDRNNQLDETDKTGLYLCMLYNGVWYLQPMRTGINNSEVVTASIADGAVGTRKIADKAIDASKIADDTITASQIADDTITASQIAPRAIGEAQINNAAVTAEQIRARSVGFSELQYNAVDRINLRHNSVHSDQIINSVVTTEKLKDGAVTKEKIADGAVPKVTQSNSTPTSSDGSIGDLWFFKSTSDFILGGYRHQIYIKFDATTWVKIWETYVPPFSPGGNG